jgi:hypothetical protein
MTRWTLLLLIAALVLACFILALGGGGQGGRRHRQRLSTRSLVIAAVNALCGGFKRFKADYRVIPWVTFTSPEDW